MSSAGTICLAVAMACARIGWPPTSCRTWGCFDLSRVPLPAAIMTTAMEIRAGCGVEFDLRFAFAMLSQYTANAVVETRLAASQTAERALVKSLGLYQGIGLAMPSVSQTTCPFRAWTQRSSPV